MMMKKPRPVREMVRVERRLVGLGRRKGQGSHATYFPCMYLHEGPVLDVPVQAGGLLPGGSRGEGGQAAGGGLGEGQE